MKLLKKEKKQLFEKITRAVGAVLRGNETHTDREISEITGISTSRITEYKNMEKYGKIIPEFHFAELLGGGIITMDQIVKKIETDETLTEREHEALKKYGMYENNVLRKYMFNAMEKGIDIVALLRDASKAVDSSVDTIKIIKK